MYKQSYAARLGKQHRTSLYFLIWKMYDGCPQWSCRNFCAKLLALSATATKEIVKRLRMKGAGTIVGNVDIPDIKLVVSTRPAGCGGKTRVEDSYDYIYSPLCAEIGNMKEFFPKTVVYTRNYRWKRG
ncbi:Hypothetical predicted protein [Mytilus galloprovincialis]|uniref:Uncharacterized protein n=1 Tax=Mytilus galloprovincialis TaxID=29158 RepID=A0A8B6DSJ7_MYTGA|nr:Hypothetical predicted protein [Mytilus galloprovincialis]